MSDEDVNWKRGGKLTIKQKLMRSSKNVLEPRAAEKRKQRAKKTEIICYGCGEAKPVADYEVEDKSNFFTDKRVRHKTMCRECDRVRRRKQNHRQWDKEEFESPYVNAYALGHTFDENLNCQNSGCHMTLEKLQSHPKTKCQSPPKNRGRARTVQKMMVKSVSKIRKF